MKIGNQLFNEQQLRQFSKNMENIQKVQDKISSGKNIIFHPMIQLEQFNYRE